MTRTLSTTAQALGCSLSGRKARDASIVVPYSYYIYIASYTGNIYSHVIIVSENDDAESKFCECRVVCCF